MTQSSSLPRLDDGLWKAHQRSPPPVAWLVQLSRPVPTRVARTLVRRRAFGLITGGGFASLPPASDASGSPSGEAASGTSGRSTEPSRPSGMPGFPPAPPAASRPAGLSDAHALASRIAAAMPGPIDRTVTFGRIARLRRRPRRSSPRRTRPSRPAAPPLRRRPGGSRDRCCSASGRGAPLARRSRTPELHGPCLGGLGGSGRIARCTAQAGADPVRDP